MSVERRWGRWRESEGQEERRREASKEKEGAGGKERTWEAGSPQREGGGGWGEEGWRGWSVGSRAGGAGPRPISLRDIGGILGLAATITSHLPSYPGGSRCPGSERNERPEGRAGTPRPGPAMSCGTCW